MPFEMIYPKNSNSVRPNSNLVGFAKRIFRSKIWIKPIQSFGKCYKVVEDAHIRISIKVYSAKIVKGFLKDTVYKSFRIFWVSLLRLSSMTT